MLKRILFLTIFVGMLSQLNASEKGLLLLREETSLNAEQRDSIVALFKIELQKFNIKSQVIESSDIMATIQNSKGVERFFVLDMVRLNTKYILYFAEMNSQGNKEIFSVRYSILGLDELDVVVQRIVKAVLTRKPMKTTEKIDNLSSKDSRIWNKKFGEFFWGIGIPFGFSISPGAGLAFGGNLKVMFEMKHFRIDYYLGGVATAGNSDNKLGVFLSDISVNYDFLAKNISPYAGLGVGYGIIDVNKKNGFSGYNTGPVLTLSAGAEMFRFYKVRLLAGLRVVFPLYLIKNDPDYTEKSESKWIPAFLTEVTFVW